MLANEFVKEFGWGKAKECIEFGKNYTDHEIVCRYDDLKRLVESWELVQEFGGLEGAKGEYFEIIHSGVYEVSPCFLLKAIADVEGCQ